MTMRYINRHYLSITIEKRTLYGALVVTLWTCYSVLYVVVLLLLLLLSIYLCRIQ